MVDIQRQSQNGNPKSPPAATQPAGGYERDAEIVSELSAAGTLSVIIGKTLQNSVHPAGVKLYRDELLRASGSPTDPLEVMLLEQAALAHHRILGLHTQAAGVESAEMVEVLTTAATKLTAEFRRLCLAVREYRAPVSAKNVTVLQQNLAAGDQRIAMVDQRPTGPTHKIETTADSTNQNKALTHEISPTFDSPIPGLNCAPIGTV